MNPRAFRDADPGRSSIGTMAYARPSPWRPSRRALLERAMMLGAALPVTMALGRPHSASARAEGTAPEGHAPDAGTDRQTRGAGKELRILVASPPSVAATYSARATVDFIAAALVMEPLMHLLPDGTLIPSLIEEVPTIANGLLAEDGTRVTFIFPKDLVWSDGEPVTADDLVFTWKWVTTTTNPSNGYTTWSVIAGIEATDAQTAVVTFHTPSAGWFLPFIGSDDGALYPAHCFDNDPANPNEAFLTAPIGTGPYVVTTFSPSGMITYDINDRYRDPAKPYFERVTIDVYRDAPSAVDAVVTGVADFAWGLSLTPSVLETLAGIGLDDTILTVPSGYEQALRFNFSDPNQEVDGQVSQKDTPNPVLSDPEVRRALNAAVNRGQIAATLYGPDTHTTANVLEGAEAWTSPNTSWKYDLDEANATLDAAGWVRDGDQRSKDGVELALTIAAPADDVSQKILAQLHDDFAKIGVAVTVKPVDPSLFFPRDLTGDGGQSFWQMPWDAALWLDGSASAFPATYMRRWYAGPNGENVSQRENGWLIEREAFDGVIANPQRYANPDYDALYESLETTVAREDANALLIQMNDLLVKDVAIVPILERVSYGVASDRVRRENLALSPFENPLWNIANWNDGASTAG